MPLSHPRRRRDPQHSAQKIKPSSEHPTNRHTGPLTAEKVRKSRDLENGS
jgi:hypothetical protein